jgi:hypothetical protein
MRTVVTDKAKYRRLRASGVSHKEALALSALEPNPDFAPDPDSLYDAQLGWELQSGSDTPAASINDPGFIAVTDENGAVLIGDIAYLVSGYVANETAYAGLTGNPVFGPIAIDDTWHVISTMVVPAGHLYWGVPPNGHAVSNLKIAPVGGRTWTAGDAFTQDYDPTDPAPDYCWPFIERYDLKNKTWLPRVPMPIVDDGQYQYTAPVALGFPGNPGQTIRVSHAGPFHLPAGELPVPPAQPDGMNERYTLFASRPSIPGYQPPDSLFIYKDGNGDAGGGLAHDGGGNATYPEGVYWVQVAQWSGPTSPPQAAVDTAQQLGDSLGSRASVPAKKYAGEGGIVGAIDGKIYFGGGDAQFTTGKEFFVYDPATGDITRLADMPADDYPDYNPYGVVAGKMWYFGYAGDAAYSYDPTGPDEWATHTTTGVDLGSEVGDQVGGFEHDGKLLFAAYGAVWEFDPETLVGAAKATSGFNGVTFLIGDRILASMRNSAHGWYDIASDTWSTATDVVGPGPSTYTTDYAGVTHKGTPYLLSAIGNGSDHGIWSLTAKSYSDAPAKLLAMINDLTAEDASQIGSLANLLGEVRNRQKGMFAIEGRPTASFPLYAPNADVRRAGGVVALLAAEPQIFYLFDVPQTLTGYVMLSKINADGTFGARAMYSYTLTGAGPYGMVLTHTSGPAPLTAPSPTYGSPFMDVVADGLFIIEVV